MDKPEKEIIVKCAGKLVSADIFEQVQLSEGIYAYAVWEKQIDGNFLVRQASSYSTNVLYKPLDQVPWLSPGMPIEYPSELELWNEVKAFIVDYWDYWDSKVYDVLTAMIFNSWNIEALNVLNYVFFLGPPGTGKTKGLEIFYFLARRAILGSSFSSAALARAVEAYEPFLLLDEAEILQKDAMQEAIGILNSGYRRGSFYIRARKDEGGNMELELVKTFGYKALSGTKQLASTLEDRCILLSMRETRRQLKDLWSHDSQVLAKNLRSCLLMYRFKKLSNWVKGEPFEGFEGLEGILEKLQSSRLRELFRNLIAVAPSNEIRGTILSYALNLEKSRKEEKSTGLDAEIVQSIEDLYKAENYEKNTIEVMSITNRLNEKRSENEKIKSMIVGLVTKTLGFQKTRLHGGNVAIRIDPEHFESLKKSYLPDNGEEEAQGIPQKPSQGSQPSPLHPNTLDYAGKPVCFDCQKNLDCGYKPTSDCSFFEKRLGSV